MSTSPIHSHISQHHLGKRGASAPDKIRLVPPTEVSAAAALEFRQEFLNAGESVINGSSLLDQTPAYADWLAHAQAQADPATVPPGWVRTEVFFAVREADARIVGIIDLRHELNDFLRDFGHCGFSVRPSERQRGYATAMLQQLCAHARACGMPQLQLSAEVDNTPSLRTIAKAGGRPLRRFQHEGREAVVHLLPLSPTL